MNEAAKLTLEDWSHARTPPEAARVGDALKERAMAAKC
jgi:hypothetical protein